MAVSHIMIIIWKPIRNVVAYIRAVENYSAIKKQWNNSFCSNMEGPRDYHSKWSKPKINTKWYHLYVEYKTWYKWTYFKNTYILTDKRRKEKKYLNLWCHAASAPKQRVKYSQNTFGFQSSNLTLADGPNLSFQASEGLQGGHHGVSLPGHLGSAFSGK